MFLFYNTKQLLKLTKITSQMLPPVCMCVCDSLKQVNSPWEISAVPIEEIQTLCTYKFFSTTV